MIVLFNIQLDTTPGIEKTLVLLLLIVKRGLVPGKSTTAQIFGLRQNLDNTIEFQVHINHRFIDFKAAYDYEYMQELYITMVFSSMKHYPNTQWRTKHLQPNWIQ